jgi:hypothetical protein
VARAIRAKRTGVEMMKYTGFNRWEIHNWMKDSALETLAFGYVGERDSMHVHPGDIVIKTSEGKFFTMTQETFDEQYDILGD